MGVDVFPFESAQVGRLSGALRLRPCEATLLSLDHPFLRHGDWRLFASVRRGEVAARAVAAVDPRQRSGQRPVGTVGFVEENGDLEALARALSAALGWLQRQGAAVARAPVQFSTWFGHRAVVDGFPDQGGGPPFPLEPRNGRLVVVALAQAGFCPAHRAESYLVDAAELAGSAQRARETHQRLGLRHRPLRLDHLDEELALLHRIASAAFERSWGSAPISAEEFLAFYRPLAGSVDREFVRVLEDFRGAGLGFVFALPTAGGILESRAIRADPQGGRAPVDFVVKTLAMAPWAPKGTLGAGLLAALHELAAGRGYRHGVHALMAEGSSSCRYSARRGRWMRSYATFERALVA